MTLVRTEAFLRDFRSLPDDLQRKAEETIRRLVENPRHPSLQTKKMQPKDLGIFEVRVTRGYRLTFSAEKDRIILRRIGTHDILRVP